ncbi:hypothetical protein B0H11DRAFT_1791854 [Mycena galericulata]|nr:hypothetical protein B0H11DRAFT_1791854 [Mycena galericulata]
MDARSKPAHESYLIIGGGTSLGETIVEQLLGRGETRVSIFDAQPLATGQAARFGDSVRVFVGDILAPGSIAEALKSCATTCIIHTGMISIPITLTSLSLQTSVEPLSPREEAVKLKELSKLHKKINTDGMRNLLAAALESGSATQLLYVGSADILFDGHDRPLLREADAPYPVKCWDPELEGRYLGERMVLSFNGVNALRTAVIRPATIFGPSYAFDRALRRIQANPVIASVQIGENTNRIDKTYIANAAHAAVLAADRLAPAHPQHAATAGRAFFISDGDPRPFWDFMRALWTNVGGTVPKNGPVVGKSTAMFFAGVKDMVGNLQGENRGMWKKMQFLCANRSYDISLAREVLGYEPIVSHDEGIRRTAEWWLERQLTMCKGKKAVTEPATEKTPMPYDREEATLLTEKSPFF